MHVTPAELAESVAALVRIPSVNPLHFGPRAEAAGDAGEAAIAAHLADRFRAIDAEVVLDEAAPGRPNVYATVAGRSDRLVVLDVHTDTVTVEHMIDHPFDGRIEDGRVWGRGALDTKASMGVIVALLEAWHAAGKRPEPTLMVVGSVGEEAGGLLGAIRFRAWAEQRSLPIAEMIVAEPTQLAPIHGHKGGVMMQLTAIGESAHSAVPHLGKNAVEAMAPVIVALMAEHERLQAAPPSTELGTGTLTVTQITGGTGGNVVPDRCSITVGRRGVPGENPNELFASIAAIAKAACPLPIEAISIVPPSPNGDVGTFAFYQGADSPLVQLLATASGNAPTVAAFGTNALRYHDFVPDKAVFGPGSIDDAHQATESVAIADLITLADVYTRWLNPG